jgi:hypothetical protein
VRSLQVHGYFQKNRLASLATGIFPQKRIKPSREEFVLSLNNSGTKRKQKPCSFFNGQNKTGNRLSIAQKSSFSERDYRTA